MSATHVQGKQMSGTSSSLRDQTNRLEYKCEDSFYLMADYEACRLIHILTLHSYCKVNCHRSFVDML